MVKDIQPCIRVPNSWKRLRQSYILSSLQFVIIKQIVKQMAYKHWENEVLVIHWHPLSPPAAASVFMTSTSLKVIHNKPSSSLFWKSYQLGDEHSIGDIIHLGFIKVSLPNDSHSAAYWIFHSPNTGCLIHARQKPWFYKLPSPLEDFSLCDLVRRSACQSPDRVFAENLGTLPSFASRLLGWCCDGALAGSRC